MIDYALIARASTFYETVGYKRVESPWLVTRQIADITCPEGRDSFLVQKTSENHSKVFVASGEQSFLYLITKGFLPDGKYQTITPCLRNDLFDSTHTKYFMKLELIHHSTLHTLADVHLRCMLDDARSFFWDKLQIAVELRETAEGYDLYYRDVEVGSYGRRACTFCNWVYGTGLAEPRTSRLRDMTWDIT